MEYHLFAPGYEYLSWKLLLFSKSGAIDSHRYENETITRIVSRAMKVLHATRI